MSKIIVKTPATSANLGTGFDFIGLSLNLYNEYEFDTNTQNTCCVGFSCNDEDNYVLKSYTYIMNKYNNEKVINVKITQIKQDIPQARGLGSSSSALAAGIIAANELLGNKLDNSKLMAEMVTLEGHPDNIIPCFVGGLTSVLLDDGVNFYKYKVSKKLGFIVIIPDYKVLTSEARNALPDTLTYANLTNNASRVIRLPFAFENGDIDEINKACKDQVHETYRSKLIKEWDEVKDALKDEKVSIRVSGSGPTILIIYNKKEESKIINKINKYNYHVVSVDNEGSKIKVVK